MATDLYGIRLLAVDHDALSIRFRVFVVYYDTAARTHAPLPEDPLFFLRLLWDFAEWHHPDTPGADGARGPLAEVVGYDDLRDVHDDTTDYEKHICWPATNTRWFVADVTRVAERNHPLPARHDAWKKLHDFSYLRAGGWSDEELLIQADYDVRVTDARWLAGLTEGFTWATAWYPSPHIGVIREQDAPHVTDFVDPVAVVTPFGEHGPDDLAGGVEELAFSDDGGYLAVRSVHHEIAIFATADWSLRTRITPDSSADVDFPTMKWVPGEHVVTLHERLESRQWAYDVETNTVVRVEPQTGDVRSRTGRHRAKVEFGDGAEVSTAPDGPLRVGGVGPGAAGFDVQDIAFTRDESRMLLIGSKELRVADPATGEIFSTVSTGIGGVSGFTASPSGEHVALFESRGLSRFDEPEAAIHRTADGALVVRATTGQVMDAIAWSPDGTLIALALHGVESGAFLPSEIRIFRVGLPERPPRNLTPEQAG